MTDLWEGVPEAGGHDLAPGWEGWTGDDRPIGDEGTWLDSAGLCAWVRERTDHVLLGFSSGKDSIASWHRLLEYWPAENIWPYHLYLTPHMGFVNRSLDYYEREFGRPILRLPNRSVFRLLNDAVFQPPSNLPVIWGAQFPDFTYPDIYELIAEQLGLTDARPWVAHGVRSADSPMRRMLLNKHGPWRPNQRVFYAIHDYYVRDVRRVLEETGTKLPVDYRLFGRSFDGLDHRFTKPIRDTFPDDYRVLTDLYPLVGLDSWRRGEMDAPDV